MSPAISNIHEKTVRVEKNQVAGEKEFYTKRGKYIPKGDLYHIHYTKDLEVYYMSGGEHNEQTKLIFKSDFNIDILKQSFFTSFIYEIYKFELSINRSLILISSEFKKIIELS